MIAKIKQWITARREKRLREWLRQATIKGDLTIEGNLIVKGTITSLLTPSNEKSDVMWGKAKTTSMRCPYRKASCNHSSDIGTIDNLS